MDDKNFTDDSVLFIDGEPITHRVVESYAELVEEAFAILDEQGRLPLFVADETYYRDDKVPDADTWFKWADFHSGILDQCWWIVDANKEPCRITVLSAPYYWTDMPVGMEDIAYEYCVNNGLFIWDEPK